ncbi:MAG: 3-oxoadipate CoA-transferase [Candidatus Zixiibacteriota bacterium]|nr:MAG: 3-oxoadipate CoA-transferase [candidate division Zixibacteria bacterium]
MIDKRKKSIEESLDGLLKDGVTLLIGGFGDSGAPFELMQGVLTAGFRDLTIVSNNAGTGDRGIAALLEAGLVKKVICSYPRSSGAYVIERMYKEGAVELEVVPQGTLVERIRCGGAGLGGFYTPTGIGTPMAEGKEVKIIKGREYILEEALFGDIALIKAAVADRWGNLLYTKASRNFGPVMATSASRTIVQVCKTVELGCLNPEAIVTPGIFVDQIVEVRADNEF